jgi:8-oxo-dGTP diphosphatase
MRLAGCIITDSEDRVLLLHRNFGSQNHWEVPGGKVEEDESTEQTALRETREELGVEVGIVRRLGHAAFHEADQHMEYTWFKAIILSGKPKVMEPEKFDDLNYFSLDGMRAIQLSTGAWNFLCMIEENKVAINESA